MKRITVLLVLLFAASPCFAQQMYTVTDLGTLGGSWSEATGINASGQVVGNTTAAEWPNSRAFRTSPNNPINPATDDIGSPYCDSFRAYCIG